MTATPADIWAAGPTHHEWCSPEVTPWILGEVEAACGPIPRHWTRTCCRRLHNMRDALRNSFVGLTDECDWLLSALIARQNVLLLGPPGVAKTELSLRCFELLGLKQASAERQELLEGFQEGKPLAELWATREEQEKAVQKYFHYLLSRFTQVEELFGPIEIGLLRQGILGRVNFGLLTGPGVRAAFLDEIFKASSSILNALLTLTQERMYFNFGGMVKSDITMFIGASNELPGGFASGAYGVGSGLDDFQALHAFLDRFPLRVRIYPASATPGAVPAAESQLAQATDMAVRRQRRWFATGARFEPLRDRMPCINDILLLGRACMAPEPNMPGEGLYVSVAHRRFWDAFMGIGAALQPDTTSSQSGNITWTISPRKLAQLYQIAIAHALVCDNRFVNDADYLGGPDAQDLGVFYHLWDTPTAEGELRRLVEPLIDRFERAGPST